MLDFVVSPQKQPIAFFDSGIGGLSIYAAVEKILPGENYLYLADRAFFPYGEKSTRALKNRTYAIIDWLKKQGAKLIVTACNTATVSSLSAMRKVHPDIPIIGTVPVIKTCAEQTRNGCIGILCTSKTAHSAYQKRLIKTFAPKKQVYVESCPGLVEAIEYGADTVATATLLQKPIQKLLKHNIDTLALGCSHFPLITADIQAHIGKQIMIFDSAQAIARQVQRVLKRNNALNPTKANGATSFFTTGNSKKFDIMIERYLQRTVHSKHIQLQSKT